MQHPSDLRYDYLRLVDVIDDEKSGIQTPMRPAAQCLSVSLSLILGRNARRAPRTKDRKAGSTNLDWEAGVNGQNAT